MLSTKLSSLASKMRTSTAPHRAHQAIRAMADISVEHGRGEWKLYGDLANYKPGKFQIQTLNKISPKGLQKFPEEHYDVRTEGEEAANAHAILLRSHKLKEEEVAHTVRAIARCGAGTNNIPVARMTELGIPVFNTPGANANAVKELVICGMLLGSRRIIDGVNHMKELGKQGLARERVEKDKAMFGGQELTGKTLAVLGLGHIGSLTARDAFSLGMQLKGMLGRTGPVKKGSHPNADMFYSSLRTSS
jgi:D-3-phosphoglycerate dehydrogenase